MLRFVLILFLRGEKPNKTLQACLPVLKHKEAAVPGVTSRVDCASSCSKVAE